MRCIQPSGQVNHAVPVQVYTFGSPAVGDLAFSTFATSTLTNG